MSVETSAAQPASTSADFMASVSSSEKQNRVSGFAISDEVVLETKDVNVYYGNHHALHDTSLAFHKDEITALIGPSGCGKSTFLRSLNLMNREIRGCRVEGEIEYRGHNINIPAPVSPRAVPDGTGDLAGGGAVAFGNRGAGAVGRGQR